MSPPTSYTSKRFRVALSSFTNNALNSAVDEVVKPSSSKVVHRVCRDQPLFFGRSGYDRAVHQRAEKPASAWRSCVNDSEIGRVIGLEPFVRRSRIHV